MALIHLVTVASSLLFLGVLGVIMWCSTPRRRAIAAVSTLMLLSAGILALGDLDSKRRAGHVVTPTLWLFSGGVQAQAAMVLAAIVERYGGLPEDSVMMEKERGVYRLPQTTRTVPISSYRLTAVRLFDETPLMQAMLDDDPTYRIEARVLVTNNEGEERWFELLTWRYGLYLGFLTLPPAGDGPGWRWSPLEDY